MGRVYRTAHGKAIDIDNIRLANEDTIAVGNMKVNARGDQLGPGGKVVQTRNQAMDQYYKIHTPTAMDTDQPSDVTAELNIAPDGESFDPPEEQQPPQQQLRGSLADSIAKQVTVQQELLDPNPNKPKGPQRI